MSYANFYLSGALGKNSQDLAGRCPFGEPAAEGVHAADARQLFRGDLGASVARVIELHLSYYPTQAHHDTCSSRRLLG